MQEQCVKHEVQVRERIQNAAVSPDLPPPEKRRDTIFRHLCESEPQ